MNPKLKKALRIIGLLIFSALGIKILSPYIAKVPDSINAIKDLNYLALSSAIFFEFLRYAACAFLLNSILGLFKDRVSLWQGMLIVLASASFGMVAGGMAGSIAASIQWLRKRNVKMQAATIASILPNLLNNVAIFLLSLVGFLYLWSLKALTSSQLNAFLIILTLLVVALFFMGLFLVQREKATALFLSLAEKISKTFKKSLDEIKMKDQIKEIYEVWDVILKRKWWEPLLGLVMSFGFDMTALYSLFYAAGELPSLKTLIIGYGLPQIFGKAAFVLPGGIGVVESTMISLYEKLGISSLNTVMVVLAYRFLAFIVPTFLGFLLVFYLQKDIGKKKTGVETIKNIGD